MEEEMEITTEVAMEQIKWFCLSCNNSGECACYAVQDILDLPDFTIVPSHEQESPDCKKKKAYMAIAGNVYEATERLKGDTSPVRQCFHVPPEVILKLTELNGKKIAIIGSSSPPHYTGRFKDFVAGLGREDEVRVFETIPQTTSELESYALARRAKDQKHIVIFVGAENAWGRWEYMLKKQRISSLLHRSIGFAI